jgi:hypothetical protein
MQLGDDQLVAGVGRSCASRGRTLLQRGELCNDFTYLVGVNRLIVIVVILRNGRLRNRRVECALSGIARTVSD